MITRLLTVLMLVFAAEAADAQIQDRAKDRAEQKANNRVDRKIDQGIDSGLDAIEGLFKRKNKNDKNKEDAGEAEVKENAADDEATQQAENAMTNAFFGGSDVNLKPSYSFDQSVTMRTTIYDKKGKQDMVQNMDILFADDHPHICMRVTMEGTDMDMIMDMDENYMVMLTDAGGRKMAMVTKFDPAAYDQNDEEAEDFQSMNFTKTGRTKEILGYTCEEYTAEDDDMTYQYWMGDVDVDIYKGFMAMREQQKEQGNEFEGMPEGTMMEMVAQSKKDGESTTMQVTSIDMNKANTISTEGYETMSLGGSR